MANETKLLKLDMSLNTIVEANKQINTAARQLKPFHPNDKPITPFTVTSADAGYHKRLFGTPKTSIKVHNLMNNGGISYP